VQTHSGQYSLQHTCLAVPTSKHAHSGLCSPHHACLVVGTSRYGLSIGDIHSALRDGAGASYDPLLAFKHWKPANFEFTSDLTNDELVAAFDLPINATALGCVPSETCWSAHILLFEHSLVLPFLALPRVTRTLHRVYSNSTQMRSRLFLHRIWFSSFKANALSSGLGAHAHGLRDCLFDSLRLPLSFSFSRPCSFLCSLFTRRCFVAADPPIQHAQTRYVHVALSRSLFSSTRSFNRRIFLRQSTQI
jgi:hypothetical protein